MSLKRKKVSFDKRWRNLEDASLSILQVKESKVKAMDLSSDVYDLCNAEQTEFKDKLYNSFKELFTRFVENMLKAIIDSEDLLKKYVEAWGNYRIGISHINIICKYLNDLYIKEKDTRHPPIESMALSVWKESMIEHIYKHRDNKLMKKVFTTLEKSREEHTMTDLSSVSNVLKSLLTLDNNIKPDQRDFYEEMFENPYLKQSKEFYKRESNNEITKSDITSYMSHVEKRINEEMSRCQLTSDNTTTAKVIKEVDNELISAHIEVFKTECSRMIQQEMLQEFGKSYTLLSRVSDGVKPVLKILEEYISEVGLSEIQNLGSEVQQNPKDYVEKLLDLHAKYTDLTKTAVQNDIAFMSSVDKAFRVIINDTKRNPLAKGPELLARYSDYLLKKSARVESERDLEERLSRLIILFNYLDDKDIFQKYYSKFLAKRLIQEMSVSDDAESGMISRLKNTCGTEYTSKLQRMFTDVSLSREIEEKHKKESKHASQLGILVLTTGSWPIQTAATTTFAPPIEFERDIESFRSYYSAQFNGRKLTWLYHLSRAELKLNYLPRKYEIQVSLYQASVLLLFNDKTTLTIADITQNLQLNSVESEKSAKSLADAKLLIQQGDTYTINTQFSSKKMKIKIGGGQQQEASETIETNKQIDVDRQMFLQALIVRIMKTSKTLTHNQLIEKVIVDSKKFTPNITGIKKSIDCLIERSFIERDPKNRDSYLYIA